MSFFSNLWNFGGGVVGSLAKVAALGFASKLLSDNINESSTNQAAPVVDEGVRLQLDPSTDNQIPVLYGEAYFGGYITDAQLASDYKSMTYCLTLAETTGQLLSTGANSSYTFKGLYFNNNRVVFKADGITVDYTLDSSGNQDVSMRDLVKVYFYQGQSGIQPQGSSGSTPSPSSVMPGWTSGTHPMSNLIYAIVQVTYSRDKNVTGLPNCTFHIENSMTLPGDVLVDYMINSRYGASIPLTDIDSSFIDLNTYCSAGFSYKTAAGTVTSGPIEINGLVDTSTVVLTNMEELAKAGHSWLSYDIHSGKWIVVINKAESSIASLDDSNIIGEISISGTSLTQLSNVANVKYQNTDILDKTDFVKVSIPSGELLPNEPETTLELSLPFTTQQAVAMKIGLQLLKQARVDKIISFTTDYSYMNLRAGQVIDITSDVYGYTNKKFRIITVEEVEEVEGQLQLQFKALEYDPNVYVYDIQEYLVETDDGILGIGSIGKPNVPVVTKTEQSNVPKILISAVVPSGVVDAMEYWLTFDVNVGNDSARTYIHIGTYANTNGTALTENQTVSYTYSGLGQSDFFIKVRGVNSVATGPYSDPTGLIAYNPIVVADTVTDDPVVGLDGQLMGLGLLTLLNNLDKLFGGDTTTGSLWDKIFSLFKDETGVDIVQDAKDGNLGGGGGTPTTPKTYMPYGQYKYPLDRETYEDPEKPQWQISDNSIYYLDAAPNNDVDWTYYKFSGSAADYTDPSAEFWFTLDTSETLSIGSGSVSLYKSNGTLVQSKSASSLTIDNEKKKVGVQFTQVQEGVDYYILVDEGVVKNSSGAINSTIDTPSIWNFHTRTPSPKIKPEIMWPPLPTGCYSIQYVGIITKLFEDVISIDNRNVDIESNIGIKFNQSIFLQKSGTITISSGSIFQVIDLSKTFKDNKVSEELVWVKDNILYVNPTSDFARGTTYSLTISAGCLKNKCGQSNTEITTDVWTTYSGPVGYVSTTNDVRDGITLNYRELATFGPGSLSIKNSSGIVIANIDKYDPALSLITYS